MWTRRPVCRPAWSAIKAGFINPRHTHPCAHGLYVLEGTLVTQGSHYGPGHFLWFPEGKVMEQGTTPEADATVLFITNKPFTIHYQLTEGFRI